MNLNQWQVLTIKDKDSIGVSEQFGGRLDLI